MKQYLALLMSAFMLSESHACERVKDQEPAMSCSSQISAEESSIIGSWYFYMGSGSHLKLELKTNNKFSVAVFSSKNHAENIEMGGSWLMSKEAIELSWPDGTKKIEKVVFLSDCEMHTETNGKLQVYQRKPLAPASNNSFQG